MEVLDAIFHRKSVRKYSDTPISERDMQTILRAGMTGPCCVNARDWAFLVVKDKDRLEKMADANGPMAQWLRKCAAAIMVLGDTKKSFPKAKDYWIIDCAIAMQNMTLAAEGLGIGSVWLGTYPEMERVDKQKQLFQLPEHMIPHSILALGYPENGELTRAVEKTLETDKIYYEVFEHRV